MSNKTAIKSNNTKQITVEDNIKNTSQPQLSPYNKPAIIK